MWRELGDAGDADALHEIYDTFKSYDRSENGKAKLVTRVEAEAALRKAAELGRPYSMWILAVLLDRGSTVKRDPAGAIAWAQRAMANPPQDTTRADIETRLGHFLAKSSDADQRSRGLANWERYAPARGDAKAYLAMALRQQDPIRARKLLEAALKGAPGHAIPALTEMLLRGEGGPKDEKRALSLLQGRTASDVAAVRAALGRLQIEGRLVPKNVAQGIGLIRGEAAWSQEVQIEVMGLLVENEIDVDLSRIEPTARTRVRDVVDFEANVLGRGYFKRRFRALFVIALLVVARPWWWNIADARSASGVPAQTIGADVTARAAYVADGPRR